MEKNSVMLPGLRDRESEEQGTEPGPQSYLGESRDNRAALQLWRTRRPPAGTDEVTEPKRWFALLSVASLKAFLLQTPPLESGRCRVALPMKEVNSRIWGR